MTGRVATKPIDRKDGWTPELDQILLDVVIEGLQDGLTQVACFGLAAQKIGKRKSACAFRFNTTIGKQAFESIEHAKTIGKRKRNDESFSDFTDSPLQQTTYGQQVSFEQETSNDGSQTNEFSLDTVIQMLKMIQSHHELVEDNTHRRKVAELESVLSNVLNQIDTIKQQLENSLLMIQE